MSTAIARKLFGTDGIRGVAGQFPLDPLTAHAFGSALGNWAKEHDSDPEVVIGMDTRESGPWLAAQGRRQERRAAPLSRPRPGCRLVWHLAT